MATLRRLTAAGAVEAEIPLDRAELTFGRGQENDVVIGEKLVSRRHARLVRTAGGGHLLLDEGSNTGVMMGETRVSHRELREGDVFQIGFVRFQYTGAGSAPAPRPGGGGGWKIAVVLVVLAILGGAVAAVMILGRGDDKSATEAGGGGERSGGAELAPLGAADFLRTTLALASQVAALDRAEQALIDHAGAGDPVVIDEDLRAVAAAALEAGLTASQLADTVAVNDRSAPGRTMREQYRSVARTGYALVVVAQDARDRLAANQPGAAASIGKIIATWGARLWNPEVRAIGTPPPGLVMVPIPAGSGLRSWISSSTATVTERLSFDLEGGAAPDLSISALRQMTTAAGQRDGRAARAVAIAKLAGAGADLDGRGATVAMFAGVSLAEIGEKALDGVAIFVPGAATKVGDIKAGVVQSHVDDFLEGLKPNPINPDARPVTIAATPPPTVTIVIGRVNWPSDATTKVQVDVSWTAPPGTGDLTIVCQIPGYGSVETTGKGSGKTRLEIPLSGAPGSATLGVRCSAKDGSGVEIGWKETAVDPLTEPLIEIDGGAVTAAVDAGAVAQIADAAAAVPVAVDAAGLGDTSWIEPYVESFEADLVAKRPDDAVAIAIVADDLRVCLHAAVDAGIGSVSAKTQCARALKSGKPPDFTAVDAGTAPVTVGGGWTGTFVGGIAARVTFEGKTRTINVGQVLAIKQSGNKLTLTDKEGEVVTLTISGDGTTASGKASMDNIESTVDLTLDGDTLHLKSRFTDGDGGGGSMSGTLTRK